MVSYDSGNDLTNEDVMVGENGNPNSVVENLGRTQCPHCRTDMRTELEKKLGVIPPKEVFVDLVTR